MVSCACPIGGRASENVMNEKTCAACDCELDENVITVTIGGRAVEVCCEECAEKLRDAGAQA
jgi:hypothetical protein